MARAKEALSHYSEPPRGHTYMSKGELNWLANFIWGIADDVLRDLYVRGKYRDVILPITVLRRLDAVLEPTKKAALDMKAALDKAGITSQDLALRQAAGQAFYNTSKFNLRDLKARASQLRADFEAYLDGSRQMYKTSSIILNSAIRFRAFRKAMRWGRSSRSSSIPR